MGIPGSQNGGSWMGMMINLCCKKMVKLGKKTPVKEWW